MTLDATHDSQAPTRISTANGPWIVMRTNLAGCPKISEMATRMNCPEALVLGGCFLLWAMADTHTIDGRLELSAATLNRKIGIENFAEQMAAVGWLQIGEGFVTIVRFEEHNGKTAKRRAQDASRQAKHRQTKECHATVTHDRDTSVTKRKSKSKINNSISVSGDEVLIPESMRGPEVQKKAAFWFQHLELMAPDKVPMQNSPQMQSFWEEAARIGPEKFIRSVDYTTSRGWINLRDPDESKKGTPRNGKQFEGSSGVPTGSVDRQRRNMEDIVSLFDSKTVRTGSVQADSGT